MKMLCGRNGKSALLVLASLIMAAFWVSLAHPEVIRPYGGAAVAGLRVLYGMVTAGLVALGLKR